MDMQGSRQCKDGASHTVARETLGPGEGNPPFPKTQSRIHLQLHMTMINAKLLRDTIGAKISINAIGFLAKDRADTEGQKNRHTQGTGDLNTR